MHRPSWAVSGDFLPAWSDRTNFSVGCVVVGDPMSPPELGPPSPADSTPEEQAETTPPSETPPASHRPARSSERRSMPSVSNLFILSISVSMPSGFLGCARLHRLYCHDVARAT